ncbi:tetratricopeptide repeat protein [Bacillus sp. JCM 19041]|uniref:tetratricopeptide repeat protein n=1 Tax=Bacillus sp. JCM 19041 TaxID=1460637 RepID=UPI0006D1955C
MVATLSDALTLRSKGELEQSNKVIAQLVHDEPANAALHYQYAWSFDILGKESKAAPHYEQAIQLGLSGKELEGAYVGLGSTYRTLGQYDQSIQTFTRGLKLFPDNKALQTFLAMTLYNENRHAEAMELLLNALASSSNDPTIQEYKKAILFYSDKLDQTWLD